MIVIASANGAIGIMESMRVLQAGGSALDAVEAGIRLVEDNPADHTVGYGGYPKFDGNHQSSTATPAETGIVRTFTTVWQQASRFRWKCYA